MALSFPDAWLDHLQRLLVTIVGNYYLVDLIQQTADLRLECGKSGIAIHGKMHLLGESDEFCNIEISKLQSDFGHR